MGNMKIMDDGDQKKTNDLNGTWTLFIINVLEKSIERREQPHLAKFWKLDCLQTEIKAIFDPTNNCTLGEYVQSYEEALKMASSCRYFQDFEVRIRLIDCLSYYDSLRFTRNRYLKKHDLSLFDNVTQLDISWVRNPKEKTSKLQSLLELIFQTSF